MNNAVPVALPHWHIPLKSVELLIRRGLTAADASPFIVHVSLSEPDEAKVRNGLRAFAKGRASNIAQALTKFPAASAWLLATDLARQYRSGSSDSVVTGQIYPHIAAAFATSPIEQAQRQDLVTEFRRAARRFGLVLPPRKTNFLADSYVCQAGAARSQLSALVRAFLKAEASFGSPPDEDTQRLNMWEVRSTQTFALGLSRLQNIMVWDESAFHAGCFARARRGDVAWPLAQDMATAIADIEAKGGIGGRSIEVRARIALVDSIPAIVAPDGASIEAQIGTRTRLIAAGRSWELPAPWPARIYASTANGTDETGIDLPFLPTLESIAVFDADSGVLLGCLSSDGASLSVDAREVALASRSEISADGETSLQVSNQAHILFASLGERFNVTAGGTSYQLTPPSRPNLAFDAIRVASGPGGGLFTHPGLVHIRFPGGMPEKAALSISHPALVHPISLDMEEDNAPIDLGALLPRSGPIGQLSLAITLGQGGRTLVRSSHWVWPGLAGLDGFAFDGPIPPNLVADQSENIAVGDHRVGLDASTQWRNARIAVSEGNRIIVFALSRPGRSVSIVDEYGRERPHPVGARITVLRESTDRLVIRTDDPAAKLIIRGRTEESSFGSSGVRRLDLAALAHSGSDNRILYLPDGDARRAEILAELGLSTEPTNFTVEHSARDRCLRIRAQFDVPIDAVCLTLDGLDGEQTCQWVAPLGRRPADGNHSPQFWGSVEYGGRSAAASDVTLVIDDQLIDSCRVGELSVRIESEERYRELRNMRGDAFLFLTDGQPSLSSTSAYLAANDLLARCVAPETWDLVKPIVPAWREAGRALVDRGRTEELLRGWGRPLPVGQASTWVPLRHPVEIAPELLSLDAVHFHAFGVEGDGTEELEQLHRLASIERVREASEVLLVDPLFFLGFSNWQDAERTSARLRDFSFPRLISTRKLMAQPKASPSLWRPSEGRLSDWHHEWCVDRFIDRFQLAMPDDTSNHERMLRLNKMITATARDHKDEAVPISELLGDRCQLAHGVAPFLSAAAKAWRLNIFASFLRDLSHRTSTVREILLEDIGLLLRLAPELTAFYLLLWELVRMTERQDA